jgi:LysM repeat protein
MKHLLNNLKAKAKTKLFRHRAEVPNLTDDPNGTPQGGGLKIMTILLFVLAAHVVVIGGFTAYGLIKGPPKEAAAPDAAPPVADAAPADKAPATPDAMPAESLAVAKDDAAPALQPGSENPPAAIHIDADPTPGTAAPVATAPAPVIDNAPKPAAPVLHTSAAAPTPVAGRAAYVVKGGDNLHKIALAHGMSVPALKEMNGLKGDAIRVGQKLVVASAAPAKAPIASAPAPAMAAAPAIATAPAPAPIAAATPEQTYTVAKGDTLTRIAKRYNTSPAALMAANKMVDPRKLKIGDVLHIPGRTDRREISSQQVAPVAIPSHHTANPDLVMNK